jgi:hypothetical protein
MPTDYSVFADLLDTYQSLSDGLQLAWLVVPVLFLLGCLALVLRYRLASRRLACLAGGRLAYTVFSEEDGRVWVIAYDDGFKGAAPVRSSGRAGEIRPRG